MKISGGPHTASQNFDPSKMKQPQYQGKRQSEQANKMEFSDENLSDGFDEDSLQVSNIKRNSKEDEFGELNVNDEL